MFAELLPPDVEVAMYDPSMAHDVHCDELRLMASAVPRRRAEFAAGRACARAALRRLGINGWPLLVGSKREPLWPAGVVGSITHTDGLVAAAVSRRPPLAGFGIDAEQRRPLPAGVRETVCTPREIAWCLAHEPSIPWDTMIFSAKESIFKAWFPATVTWLGYLEVDVVLEPGDGGRGTFGVAELSSNVAVPSASSFIGAFAAAHEFVLTSAVLEHADTNDAR
ncbi:MAG TPA: 4'-phosphopantetheinyl transferase superfamily protein [Actinomycetota bacterium]|nr:4'-phosphopantetheinyl transferase superfamily protein [Actinomycetota bacterium]